jgi:metallo-beta-lactamase family protein
MHIRFHGAVNGHVTGSCTEFYYKRTNTHFLVDCGMVQGEAHAQASNARAFPFKAIDIKFVLLTHAHLDHCGLLPKLYKDGFCGKVLCTRATADEAAAILLDSASLPECPYSRKDVAMVRFEAMDERPDFGLSRNIPIDDDLFVAFTRSAHILGSVSICIKWIDPEGAYRQIIMSGDIGPNTKENSYQSLLAGRQDPVGYPDYIVLESTYGDRGRDPQYADRDNRLKALDAVVRNSLAESSSLLIIPSFSLHRTQDILFDLFCLYGREDSAPVISGPLMTESSFEKMLQDKYISLFHYTRLENIISKHGKPEDKDILSYFSPIPAKKEKGDVRYSLGEYPSNILERLRYFVTKVPIGKPLFIHLQSPLARKVSAIYRDRLKARQIKKPSETLFRNRDLTKWLGVQSEDDVDLVFDQLFEYANHPKDEGSIKIGKIVIEFGIEFEIPDDKRKMPKILISSGGMCEGGPIINLLPMVLKNKNATFVATGYMPKSSTGAKIVELLSKPQAERGGQLQLPVYEKAGEVKIDGKDVFAKLADIRGFYSGHADMNALCDFVLNPRKQEIVKESPKAVRVFLNHGSDDARNNLKRIITERAGKNGTRDVASVELADGEGRWFDLENYLYLEKEESLEEKVDRLLIMNEELKEMLESLLERSTSPANKASSSLSVTIQ